MDKTKSNSNLNNIMSNNTQKNNQNNLSQTSLLSPAASQTSFGKEKLMVN